MSVLIRIEKDGHVMFVTEHKARFLKGRGWSTEKAPAPVIEPEVFEGADPEEDE